MSKRVTAVILMSTGKIIHPVSGFRWGCAQGQRPDRPSGRTEKHLDNFRTGPDPTALSST